MSANLYDLLQTRCSAAPTRIALATADGQTYSYADLERETARYARLLHDTLGLTAGERVAVQVEKSPPALFFYLACLRAGLIYLPLNTAYRREELAYFLDNAEPAAVLHDPALPLLGELARARAIRHCLTLDAAGAGSLVTQCTDLPDDFATVARTADDIAAILYTSGTTGRPKGAMISHGNLAANGLTLVNYWGFTADDVLLHALPLFHVHGLFIACHCALLAGAKLLFLPRFDADEITRLLPQASVLMGVPTYYTRLLKQPELDHEHCRSMRLFISGSAPLLASTFHEFAARTGHTLLERYGMTETGMNTSNPLHGERRPGTVGLHLPDVLTRIVDKNDRDMAADEVGELLVKGPNVFQGYWRMPEKTAEDFTADGYFRTGDLACQSADGYIAIVGRGKDLVISGGYNVYPKEVEGYLDALPGVLESAVIGLPHPDFGEAVAAVVVPRPGVELDGPTLIAALKERLAGFKIPKQVFIVTELPRNTMGKVQKNVLRARYGSRPSPV